MNRWGPARLPPTGPTIPDTPPIPLAPRRFGPPAVAGDAACLLVHGFTGSPWDMWPVGDALLSRGLRPHATLLRGHADGWRGISEASLEDWRDDVERPARELYEATGRPIMVVGLSMGGLLSLDLVLRGVVPVAGLACLATPLDLGPDARAAADLAKRARSRLDVNLRWPKFGGPDIQNQRPLPGASSMPLRALAELIELMDGVRRRLRDVDVPLLVVQSRHDHTSPDTSPTRLAGGVASPWVRLVVLDAGFHVITRDVSRDRVVAEVVGFADQLFE